MTWSADRSATLPAMRKLTAAAHETVDAAENDLIELDVVGESHAQDALEAIAGRKQPDGRRERVGVTLRCEPDNPCDATAIRVEVMGQLTGHVGRAHAAL